MLATAASQEEKFHYLFTLRLVTNGWSIAARKTYFEWLGRARNEFVGANMLPTALNYIRADSEATLSLAERSALTETLATLNKPAVAVTSTNAPRPFVKEWTMTELEPTLNQVGVRRDLMSYGSYVEDLTAAARQQMAAIVTLQDIARFTKEEDYCASFIALEDETMGKIAADDPPNDVGPGHLVENRPDDFNSEDRTPLVHLLEITGHFRCYVCNTAIEIAPRRMKTDVPQHVFKQQ